MAANCNMNRTREKMAPGARIFGNETTSLESPQCSARNIRVPRPLISKPSPMLMEETYHSLSTQGTCRVNERSLQTAITRENESPIPIIQPRPPPGFHKPSDVYSPPDYPVHLSTASFENSSAPASFSKDFYSPYYVSEAPTGSRLRNPLPTPSNSVDSSMYIPSLVNLQGSPPSYHDNASYVNSTYNMSDHEKLLQSLYALTATDLSRMMSGQLPDSTPGCPSPLNSQDSVIQLSDDTDSSKMSSIEPGSFTSMSYYQMANTPKLSSTKQQVLNEVPPIQKKPEPKQAPTSLMSVRVNRHNIHHIQGVNTCISSSGRNHMTSGINRANLLKSVAGYSSSKDSDVDVSKDEDLSMSPSYTKYKGCESLSERKSLADAKKQWKTLPDYGRTRFLSLKCKPGFIDSHCHLDFLLGRQYYDLTYSEYMQKHKGTYPASYEGCVAVFCHPNTFHKRDMWQKYLGENGVWGAFGCHPHHSKFYNSAVEHHLKQAFQHSKVVALGEIGLDYSNRNDCSSETQHRVFRRQLKIALQEKLPLVIHCRDANQDTMNILKEIVPRDYTIHLHCFTDGWDWAQKWLKEFPNLCIGITNLVTYFSAKPTHIVAERIPLDRLLLETDAPYFLPRKVKKTDMRYSHPGMAIHVAAQIAEIRGITVTEVIHHTRQNTTRIYGI